MFQQHYGPPYGGAGPPQQNNPAIGQLAVLLGLVASVLLSPLINEWIDTTSLHEFIVAKYSLSWAWLIEGGLKLIVFAVTFALFRAFIQLSITAIVIWAAQRLPAFA